MPLPARDLARIFGAGNELAVDIEFVRDGGNVAARAYPYREHADGYEVDVNSVRLTLPEASMPADTVRNSHLLHAGKAWRIISINPEVSGVVTLVLGDLTPS